MSENARKRTRYDVLVIGGGPAGMGAALSAQAVGARVAIIERDAHLGGILRQCIHPGFGLEHFKEELTGPEYAQRLIDQVKQTAVDVFTNTMVLSIDGGDANGAAGIDSPAPSRDSHAVHTVACMSPNGYIEFDSASVVLAMGCRERTRSEIKIPGSRPAGVFTAGLAQRYINIENLAPGRRFVILGSGDIGLIMARRLALEGFEVEGVYELMPYANGLFRNVKNCLEDFGIPLHLSTTATRIIGHDRLEAVEVSRVDQNLAPIPGTERTIPCDALLLSVGLIPENEISVAAGVKLDPRTRGAMVNQDLMTNVPGIFSCGNVLHVHDLADNATAEAERAGAAAASWANSMYVDEEDLESREGAAANVDPAPVQAENLKVEAGGIAGYALPEVISNTDKLVKLYFRVRRPHDRARIKVSSGGTAIFEGKPRAFKPSIMESMPLTPKMMQQAHGTITFSVEPVEDEDTPAKEVR